MRRLENIICPSCGQQMEEGYIFSPYQIQWTYNEKNRVFSLFDEPETIVARPIFKTNKVPAFRCNNCMIATFEYDSSI